MADEVKLITFAGETVSPLYDGLMQELYTGGGGIITGAAVTIKDASTLHITGGYGALCGREFEIFASDIPVTLSSSGNLNGRLYLHMDLSQSTNPITLLVETGSTLTPVQQDANVNTTNGVYEINLATFTVGTSAISNLQDVAPKAVKIPDALSTLNSAIAKQGDYQSIIKTQNAGTHTSLPNLSQYKYIMVAIRDGDVLVNPAIVSYKMFKAGFSAQSYIYSTATSSRRYVRATYNSDTSITLQMEDISGNGYAAVIGLN